MFLKMVSELWSSEGNSITNEKMLIISWQQLTVPHLPLINSETTWHGVGSWRGLHFWLLLSKSKSFCVDHSDFKISVSA